MNWILASTLMFISSVMLYLLVRKSSLLKTPSQFNNLAMFIVPLMVYLIMVGFTRADMRINFYEFLIILVSAIFFSYLGNVFSLKSIEYAPNPGYSLVLSKSYVLFTTIAAIFLFQATLSWQKAAAIMLIIIASALIMITKKSQDKSHVCPSLFPLSIGSFFCWGLLALSSKYLLTLGVSILARLTYLIAIVTVLILLEMRQKKIHWKMLTKEQMMVLVFMGLSSAGFNYFMQEGFNTAPNIGYVNAMNASSIAAVAFFSAVIFGDELSKQKVLGIIGMTLGLMLLVV